MKLVLLKLFISQFLDSWLCLYIYTRSEEAAAITQSASYFLTLRLFWVFFFFFNIGCFQKSISLFLLTLYYTHIFRLKFALYKDGHKNQVRGRLIIRETAYAVNLETSLREVFFIFPSVNFKTRQHWILTMTALLPPANEAINHMAPFT